MDKMTVGCFGVFAAVVLVVALVGLVSAIAHHRAETRAYRSQAQAQQDKEAQS